MSSGDCSDLRKRWDNLVGKAEKDAVAAIKQDGKNYLSEEFDRNVLDRSR